MPNGLNNSRWIHRYCDSITRMLLRSPTAPHSNLRCFHFVEVTPHAVICKLMKLSSIYRNPVYRMYSVLNFEWSQTAMLRDYGVLPWKWKRRMLYMNLSETRRLAGNVCWYARMKSSGHELRGPGDTRLRQIWDWTLHDPMGKLHVDSPTRRLCVTVMSICSIMHGTERDIRGTASPYVDHITPSPTGIELSSITKSTWSNWETWGASLLYSCTASEKQKWTTILPGRIKLASFTSFLCLAYNL